MHARSQGIPDKMLVIWELCAQDDQQNNGSVPGPKMSHRVSDEKTAQIFQQKMG